jgi:hypothetical protein
LFDKEEEEEEEEKEKEEEDEKEEDEDFKFAIQNLISVKTNKFNYARIERQSKHDS